jgi:hypothetical protein
MDIDKLKRGNLLVGFRVMQVIEVKVPTPGGSFTSHYFKPEDQSLASDWTQAMEGEGLFIAHILTDDDGLTGYRIAEGSIAMVNSEEAKATVLEVLKSKVEDAQGQFARAVEKYEG